MSNQSHLSKLSNAEKSIKDKQGPHEKDIVKSNDDQESKEEKSDTQSESGKD